MCYNKLMKIALLGYGKEGKAAEQYFKTHSKDAKFDIFENFTPDEIRAKDYSSYDIIMRSPSVPPLGLPQESSITKYFFDHCPCPIIGVTATKGKGTTCSFIKSLLDAHGAKAYLVGNIGEPAIDILDELTPESVVVYEMSSFQLWDLNKSPHIAVLGHLEPDHLNVHNDYDDYLAAKANITTHQSADDYLVFYQLNPVTARIAATSPAHQIPYPFAIPDSVKTAVSLPGEHNLNNAIAAIAAVACYLNISPDEYLSSYAAEITSGLAAFKGLPHRLEFLRELNGIKYYDDNFSTNPSSTRVAVNAFPEADLTVIIGGRDKTDNQDLPEIYEILAAPQVKHIVLMGESGHALANKYNDSRFIVVESLAEAINTARQTAETDQKTNAESITPTIVLMSPAAASFDMFENVYDRGAQFKNLILSLN